MTRFEQFQHNVQTWAAERGIYEHSTALAQALKAVSEVGELADAVIKGDREALKDAIGDVAVCLVNVAHMRGYEWDVPYIYDWDQPADRPLLEVAGLCSHGVGMCAANEAGSLTAPVWSHDVAMMGLFSVATVAGMDFDDCCEHAWQQIKDRKGHMVAGGAFVKEGE